MFKQWAQQNSLLNNSNSLHYMQAFGFLYSLLSNIFVLGLDTSGLLNYNNMQTFGFLVSLLGNSLLRFPRITTFPIDVLLTSNYSSITLYVHCRRNIQIQMVTQH